MNKRATLSYRLIIYARVRQQNKICRLLSVAYDDIDRKSLVIASAMVFIHAGVFFEPQRAGAPHLTETMTSWPHALAKCAYVILTVETATKFKVLGLSRMRMKRQRRHGGPCRTSLCTVCDITLHCWRFTSFSWIHSGRVCAEMTDGRARARTHASMHNLLFVAEKTTSDKKSPTPSSLTWTSLNRILSSVRTLYWKRRQRRSRGEKQSF